MAHNHSHHKGEKTQITTKNIDNACFRPEVNCIGAIAFNGSILRPPRKKVCTFLPVFPHLTAFNLELLPLNDFKSISSLCQRKSIFHLSVLTFTDTAVVNTEAFDQPWLATSI